MPPPKPPRKNPSQPPRKDPPRQRATGRVPQGRVPKGMVSEGVPKGGPPKSRVRQAPKERGVGKPPNPRKPALVRDVAGGILKDMFEIFKDLPRPRRTHGRKAKKAPRPR